MSDTMQSLDQLSSLMNINADDRSTFNTLSDAGVITLGAVPAMEPVTVTLSARLPDATPQIALLVVSEVVVTPAPMALPVPVGVTPLQPLTSLLTSKLPMPVAWS